MATIDDRNVEEPCLSCGAMVRKGLVRCWSCGAFMRQDIAAKYERMQQRAPEVEFKPLPERRAAAPAGGPAGHARTGTTSTSDDDFDFAGTMTDDRLAPGEDFQLGAMFAPAAAEEGSSSSISAFSGGSRTSAASKPAAKASAAAPAGPAQPAAPAEKAPKRPAASDEGSPAHSVATAGDALLQVALEEEKEAERRGRKRKPGFDPVRVSDGWLITCPCPARVRIKVKEAHRGKTGKCPNPSCGSYFTVPADLPAAEEQTAPSGETVAEAAPGFPADPAEKAGPYTHWIKDVRLHVVKPAKAKRKPGGHEKDFKPADIGFSQAAGVTVITLTSKPAGLLAKPKKPEQVRDEVLAELRAGKPLAEITAAETKLVFEPAVLGKTIVEFPPAYEHESTFAGIPVFGEGRIAVKLPPAGAPDEQHFVSLTLSQYRRLAELLAGLFEIGQFGLGCPIPREEDVVTLVCHYSENPMTVLRNPSFHLADPETPLEVVGYRCESCGLIVSEESRKKEKIGGLDGKKLAGAKCPKCKGKFGNTPLYALKPKPPTEAQPAADTGEKTQEAPAATS